jgi:NAD(P)-dependent dehydrogenase (short-subunit alcohol dehydrogenase family)
VGTSNNLEEKYMSFEHKVVLVTGGSGALGQVVVETFREAGAAVITTYTREKESGDAPGVQRFKADLSDENSVNTLYEQIASEHGRLDILANLVGGFWMGGDISETPLEQWNRMMQLNLTTAFLCARGAFALMKKNDGGKIFTVSAKAALELPPGVAAYATSKAAALALVEIIAKEGKKYNIQANAILPGTIDTEANRQAMPNADFNLWVKPREIAEVMLALSRQEISAVSGTAIKVYGKA